MDQSTVCDCRLAICSLRFERLLRRGRSLVSESCVERGQESADWSVITVVSAIGKEQVVGYRIEAEKEAAGGA